MIDTMAIVGQRGGGGGSRGGEVMGWLMAVVVNADTVDELLGASELVEGKLSCGPATAAVNVDRDKADYLSRWAR